MPRSLLLLASLSVLTFPTPVPAGILTVGVHNLANAFVNGSSLTGTLTINSAGDATPADLTFDDPDRNRPGLPSLGPPSALSVASGSDATASATLQAFDPSGNTRLPELTTAVVPGGDSAPLPAAPVHQAPELPTMTLLSTGILIIVCAAYLRPLPS